MHFDILAPLINPAIPTGMTEFHFVAVGGNSARWTLTEAEIGQSIADTEAKLAVLPAAERRDHAVRFLSHMAVADIGDDEAYAALKQIVVWMASHSIVGNLLIGGLLAQCGYLVTPRQHADETRRLQVFGIPRLAR